MILDAIVSLGSLVLPSAFDFLKKKFLPASKDTTEATLNSLATTKPEVIPAFISANASLLEAKVKYFNRDIVGEVSRWVRDLRASIRPVYVLLGIVYFFAASKFQWHVDPCIKYSMEVCISSWFGSRLTRS